MVSTKVKLRYFTQDFKAQIVLQMPTKQKSAADTAGPSFLSRLTYY